MRPHKSTHKAALDIRAALATPMSDNTQPHLSKYDFLPDEAAADFTRNFASIPAKSGAKDEPVILYHQPDGPALLIGAYGSEGRVRSWLPGLPGKINPRTLKLLNPVSPIAKTSDNRAYWGKVDLGKLPIPQVTCRDAGPYITMGFITAQDETGKIAAISAHRMLVLGPNRLGVWMLSSRHLRAMAQAAWDKGENLPVAVNIGVSPAVAIASATGTAHLPKAFDKLLLAGALANAPIEVTKSIKNDVTYLSKAEFVIEGVLTPELVPEAIGGASVKGSMPEFLGYDGEGQAELACLEITHISQRPNAAFHATVGPGREQSVILGLGGAVALALALKNQKITDLRFAHAGGGMLLLYVALEVSHRADLPALSREMIKVCPFIKTIIYVDDDIDLQCDEDVLWAMTTRAQLVNDCHALDGFQPMGMDPSQSDEWTQAKKTKTYKSYVDATIPTGFEPLSKRSFV